METGSWGVLSRIVEKFNDMITSISASEGAGGEAGWALNPGPMARAGSRVTSERGRYEGTAGIDKTPWGCTVINGREREREREREVSLAAQVNRRVMREDEDVVRG